MYVFEELLQGFRENGTTSPDSLDEIERNLGRKLPQDYREFMIRTNGGEGFVGKQYLIAWRSEELVLFNQDYQVSEYAPGNFLIASNGGGEAFGFDTRGGAFSIVQVPFVGLDLIHAKKVANSFTELIILMNSSNGSLLSD